MGRMVVYPLQGQEQDSRRCVPLASQGIGGGVPDKWWGGEGECLSQAAPASC